MKLSPKDASLEGPTVVDSTAPEGLLFHFAEGAKPLATPWQVAIERASMLAKCQLPDGIILDPACGSGIQLSAYCAVLGREGLGIELDENTAKAAAANLRRVAEQGFDSVLLESNIKIGDGRIAEGGKKVGFLHLDPARPRNSRTHGIEEMTPQLPEIFSSWKDCLSIGKKGPAILLDLSPRITEKQQLEVESIVEKFWPNLDKTWVWTSRGKGRVDRLSLWLGMASTPGVSRRFVRIPPQMKNRPIIIEGNQDEKSQSQRIPPRKGDYVSIIDSGLVDSGLAEVWLGRVLKGVKPIWAVTEGRRPQIHHSTNFEFDNQNEKLLIQSSGKIICLVHSNLEQDNIQHLVEVAREHGFGRLTLRIPLEPDVQPVLQGSLDRQLSATGGPRRGFVAQHPGDSMLLLCAIER